MEISINHEFALNCESAIIARDINRDGTVDIFDAILMSSAFNSVRDSPNWDPRADLDFSNVVDIFDAIILANNYGKTA